MFQFRHLYISKHPILGSINIDFSINETDNEKSGVSTSVIIGKNGIGKSYILRAIIDIFRVAEILKETNDAFNSPKIDYKFNISYLLNDSLYEFTNIRPLEIVSFNAPKIWSCKINNKEVSLNELQLPYKIIASSMTITDKFPTPSVGRYCYRGVRNERTPSTTGTRTLVRKVVDGIIDSFSKKTTTTDDLCNLLKNLGLKSKIEIRYKIRYKDIFLTGNQSQESLKDIYSNWRKYFPDRSGEVWGAKFFHGIQNNSNKLQIICDYLNRCAANCNIGKYPIVYDVFSEENTLIQDAEAIKLLSNLDILTFPEIKVWKQNHKHGYEFVNSSSGETQQLCQFINVMSAINQDSLILIDEPENSSHPNWQINFIEWLQKIFADYRSCHFIIATHSHFLLSDLNPQWSSIIALTKDDNNQIKNIAEDINTFCWSTDDILYRIFQVRNTRNYVFESQMMRLYHLIEDNNGNRTEIVRLVEELSRYRLNDDDPLNELLKYAELHA